MKYLRLTIFAFSLAMIVTTAAFCMPSSYPTEKSEELLDALNALLLSEDDGFIINSSDIDFCMEIMQKAFENQALVVVVGSPRISPNKDMVFIPFSIGQAEAKQHRYIVMHKHTGDSLVWAHNHSEESFLSLMKGLYDMSFYFLPSDT